ncbi:MAG: type II secretion system F family protein [Coriobacteriia bacterium]|nr:type II secretion system F family protein [Coriobacteriia bacterium]
MEVPDTLILLSLGLSACSAGALACGMFASMLWRRAETVRGRHDSRRQLGIEVPMVSRRQRHARRMQIPKCWQSLATHLDLSQQRKAQQFTTQLPDALDQIAQALEAGLSLAQAIERAAYYAPEPIREGLKHVYSHLNTGYSLEDAFAHLRKRYPSPELTLVYSGIMVQSRLGGNMKQMLQRCARYCRQSQALSRSLKTQTAQSRLSLRVILCAPFVLLAVLSLFMPGYVMPLFTTGAGRTMLVLAIVLDVIGLLWARRVLKVSL